MKHLQNKLEHKRGRKPNWEIIKGDYNGEKLSSHYKVRETTIKILLRRRYQLKWRRANTITMKITLSQYMKIIRRYFDIAFHWIIKGYEWNFPKSFGSLVIVKKCVSDKIKNSNYWKKWREIQMKRIGNKFNFEDMDSYYTVMTRGKINENGYYFRPCIRYRRKMRDVIKAGKTYRDE